MAGFKASQAVSKMAFDFSGLEIEDDKAAELLNGPEGKGVTPEPSGEQVRHFQARQRDILGLPPDTPQAEVNKRMMAMTETEFLELDSKIIEIVTDVVSERPSFEVISALPFRIREAYYGYVIGELTNFLGGLGTTRN